MKSIRYKLVLLLFFLFSVNFVFAGSAPKPGEIIKELVFEVPDDKADLAYLGLHRENKFFKIDDLGAELILMEVIGVYCPQCYKQLPYFNKLFKRIKRGRLKNKVKMFALAAGGTSMECAKLLKNNQYKFPVIADSNYVIHKKLGEPLTPFTMLLTSKGKVLYTHLGVIQNIDDLYTTIKASLR